MSLQCACTDWTENIPKVSAPFSLLNARNPTTYTGYTGKVFMYCPWCSAALQEVVGVRMDTPVNDLPITPP